MKTMFISAAWYNWVATIVFVLASDRVLALLLLESSPATLLFLHLFFSMVFLFGIAYYRAATDLAGQAEVIKLGGAAKLALFAVGVLDVTLGVVSWPILVPLTGDLIYGLLFFKALSRLPVAAID